MTFKIIPAIWLSFHVPEDSYSTTFYFRTGVKVLKVSKEMFLIYKRMLIVLMLDYWEDCMSSYGLCVKHSAHVLIDV